jgi:hypothetical protein
MPLEWKRGKNPYKNNYFGIIGVGPNTPLRQIIARAEQQARIQETEEERHRIMDASSQLQKEEVRVAELLLVHPQPVHDRRQFGRTVTLLEQAAQWPQVHDPIPLLHPLGIFWFLPAPGPQAANWPEWKEFHLVGPGDPEDLELDIVFDC